MCEDKVWTGVARNYPEFWCTASTTGREINAINEWIIMRGYV